jgi:propanediol dehydratase small subunit
MKVVDDCTDDELRVKAEYNREQASRARKAGREHAARMHEGRMNDALEEMFRRMGGLGAGHRKEGTRS